MVEVVLGLWKDEGWVRFKVRISLVKKGVQSTSTKCPLILYIMASLNILRVVSRLVNWRDEIMADTLDSLE